MSIAPLADIFVDESLVQVLLEQQFPSLANTSLALVGQGWDNYMFTLGSELAVRLPRRTISAKLIIHEQNNVNRISPNLTLPTPLVVEKGKPSPVFPWHWNIVRWLPGLPVLGDSLTSVSAPIWAEFLRSLHVSAPDDAPANPFRGVPLMERQSAVLDRLNRLGQTKVSVSEEVKTAWLQAVRTPHSVVSTWIHGDLHGGNVLCDKGQISGAVDWGDICSGDPATDLASTWSLFSGAEDRAKVLQCYQADECLIARSIGWAVLFGSMLSMSDSTDHPRYAEMGANILDRITADIQRSDF